jgi:hypothetical protein
MYAKWSGGQVVSVAGNPRVMQQCTREPAGYPPVKMTFAQLVRTIIMLFNDNSVPAIVEQLFLTF